MARLIKKDMNLYMITGTTKGLGAALKDELSRDSGNLVIGLSRAAASTIAPLNVYVELADVASITPAFDICNSMIAGKQFSRAVLVNNAGLVGPVGKFNELDAQETARNINVNLVAPLLLTRLFANATRGQAKHRLVVNISSGAAKRPIAGWSIYCAAKAGLEMATRAAALDAGSNDDSLSICSLAPGVIDTPMQAEVRSKSEREFPDVERFRAMKADGGLRDASAVAHDIIKLIDEGKLTHGGNFDIRELVV